MKGAKSPLRVQSTRIFKLFRKFKNTHSVAKRLFRHAGLPLVTKGPARERCQWQIQRPQRSGRGPDGGDQRWQGPGAYNPSVSLREPAPFTQGSLPSQALGLAVFGGRRGPGRAADSRPYGCASGLLVGADAHIGPLGIDIKSTIADRTHRRGAHGASGTGCDIHRAGGRCTRFRAEFWHCTGRWNMLYFLQF